MTLHEFYKTIHVLAAVAWVGATIVSQVHSAWVARRKRQDDFAHFIEFQAFLGNRYYAPLTLVVIVSGIAMVLDGPSNFSDAWIVIGIAIWIVSVAIGAGYLGPQGEKVKEGLAAGGPPDTVLQQRINRIKFASQAELVILIAVVADMVIKPGL